MPSRYTFSVTTRVTTIVLLVIVACLAGIAVSLWLTLRRRADKARESEARAAHVLAAATRALAEKAREQSAQDSANVTAPGTAARD